MRAHLFEFVTKSKKLSCVCGWKRILKSTDIAAAHKRFDEHRIEAAKS